MCIQPELLFQYLFCTFVMKIFTLQKSYVLNLNYKLDWNAGILRTWVQNRWICYEPHTYLSEIFSIILIILIIAILMENNNFMIIQAMTLKPDNIFYRAKKKHLLKQMSFKTTITAITGFNLMSLGSLSIL